MHANQRDRRQAAVIALTGSQQQEAYKMAERDEINQRRDWVLAVDGEWQSHSGFFSMTRSIDQDFRSHYEDAWLNMETSSIRRARPAERRSRCATCALFGMVCFSLHKINNA